ncbi:hypothetical protein HYDPIDRAFT_82261 [Hydnomerulius pinastri MD-312]|nr:hypothetical protein HYDPIDRAFT_82261 [Hydnomerulius pinastri MD-312]
MSAQETFIATTHQPNGVAKDVLSQTTPEPLQQLNGASHPPSSKTIIAVDLDDVLSQTNDEVIKWHNDTYEGSKMSLENFYYYYYWKNPYWGPPAETHDKVRRFYETNWITNAQPIDGALKGIRALQAMGYRLIIVTARGETTRPVSEAWVNKHFPECFEKILCTGQFANAQQKPGEPHTQSLKLSKAQVCIKEGAKLLIDDSMENALACANYAGSADGAGDSPRVLLFGDYQWNKRLSRSEDESDPHTVYETRVREEGTAFLEKDIALGIEAIGQANQKRPGGVIRVKDWAAVVEHVRDQGL